MKIVKLGQTLVNTWIMELVIYHSENVCLFYIIMVLLKLDLVYFDSEAPKCVYSFKREKGNMWKTVFNLLILFWFFSIIERLKDLWYSNLPGRGIQYMCITVVHWYNRGPLVNRASTGVIVTFLFLCYRLRLRFWI